MSYNLDMTYRQWLTYQLDPRELILNASAVDGSDFHQQHPIGIAVFALPALPRDMADCKFLATQTNLCSAMFQPGTARKVQPHRAQRLEELTALPFVDPVWCSLKTRRIDPKVYWAQLLQDKFTCSPRGHGVDCHRNYEALICKCIPLITGADESMWLKYQGLPVLFMQDYTELTAEWLETRYEEMLDLKYNFAPLTRSYWYNRRPDVDIDQQSERWLRKYKQWEHYKQYVLTRPPGI